MKNLIRLKDAGIREKEYARSLINEGYLPQGIMHEDMMDHGMYDTSTDEIIMMLWGIANRYKVKRA